MYLISYFTHANLIKDHDTFIFKLLRKFWGSKNLYFMLTYGYKICEESAKNQVVCELEVRVSEVLIFS